MPFSKGAQRKAQAFWALTLYQTITTSKPQNQKPANHPCKPLQTTTFSPPPMACTVSAPPSPIFTKNQTLLAKSISSSALNYVITQLNRRLVKFLELKAKQTQLQHKLSVKLIKQTNAINWGYTQRVPTFLTTINLHLIRTLFKIKMIKLYKRTQTHKLKLTKTKNKIHCSINMMIICHNNQHFIP